MGFAKLKSRGGRSPDLRVAWVGVTSPTAFVAACGSRRRVMGRRSRAVGGVASTYEGRITSCRRGLSCRLGCGPSRGASGRRLRGRAVRRTGGASRERKRGGEGKRGAVSLDPGGGRLSK